MLAADNLPAKINLLGMNLAQVEKIMSDMGQGKFRAKQLYQWLYQRSADSIDAMTDLSKDLREELKKTYCLIYPHINNHQVSSDGTEKWLFSFGTNQEIETVFIKKSGPYEESGTLCISSQIGCTLNCHFCHTGTQNLVRNLTAGEILSQILMAKRQVGDTDPQNRKITNIVFMGMGEPLYNTDEVIKAIKIMLDTQALGFSRRKVTVSTSGIATDIVRVGEETMVNLAISLHAATDELRSLIMPINKKYPLQQLISAVRQYPAIYHADIKYYDKRGAGRGRGELIGDYQGRRVTWQYVMIKDVNDKPSDAHALINLIKDIPSKINIIPFNPWQGCDYECSSEETIDIFSAIVRGAGYAVPTRRPRGRDISAACGQLKSESLKIRASQRQ